MAITTIMLVLGMILPVAALCGIYFLVKQLIQYQATIKNGKTKRESELEKMNIDDL